MECLGFKPRTAEWKLQTNPLSYGGHLLSLSLSFKISFILPRSGGHKISLSRFVSFFRFYVSRPICLFFFSSPVLFCWWYFFPIKINPTCHIFNSHPLPPSLCLSHSTFSPSNTHSNPSRKTLLISVSADLSFLFNFLSRTSPPTLSQKHSFYDQLSSRWWLIITQRPLFQQIRVSKYFGRCKQRTLTKREVSLYLLYLRFILFGSSCFA